MGDHVIIVKGEEDLPAVVSAEERKLSILHSFCTSLKYIAFVVNLFERLHVTYKISMTYVGQSKLHRYYRKYSCIFRFKQLKMMVIPRLISI